MEDEMIDFESTVLENFDATIDKPVTEAQVNF